MNSQATTNYLLTALLIALGVFWWRVESGQLPINAAINAGQEVDRRIAEAHRAFDEVERAVNSGANGQTDPETAARTRARIDQLFGAR